MLIPAIDSACQRMLAFAFALLTLFFVCSAEKPAQIVCNDKRNYTKGSQLQKNVLAVFEQLVNRSSKPAAYNTSVVGSSGKTIYGLLNCRGDTTDKQCRSCAQDAVTALQQNCRTASGGVAWFDRCYLRFENFRFIGQLDVDNFWYFSTKDNFSNPIVSETKVTQLLTALSVQAINYPDSRYAAGFNNSSIPIIYGLVQCWKDISKDECETCLYNALSALKGYVLQHGSKGGQVLSESCVNRYDTYRFFNSTSTPPSTQSIAPDYGLSYPALPSGKSPGKLPVILGAVGGSTLLLLIVALIIFLLSKRRRANSRNSPFQDEENNDLAKDDHILFFSMKVLINATDNFHEDLKIGEGGFGVVYKGTLADGQEIAVKKLSVRSLRGKQEFINEIKLVAKVQHRNLISLLGCCTEGSNRILVFEYVPNKSLDKILFGQDDRRILDWNRRYKIILGVARGLRYLHEDCKLKIIHRDIKASNILLDQKFNPKIADFGLARLFPDEQSYIETRIAGTYGYMAPEYAIKGQLSTKADVYSFGVLLLETLTGKKNSEYDPEMDIQSLLGWVWRLYQNGNLMEIIDETLGETHIQDQILRFIHIGLLCTQADSSLRPSMSIVILMLSSRSVTLPHPTIPAFVDYTQRITCISSNSHAFIQRDNSFNSPRKSVISNVNCSISDIGPR
eukprot:TRINITY_DN5455_c1_g2_i2.p1 TRINITY_DN5455_c1_g2~~TRINITY_DN5455_c1_g2_i2.p1  ORF type:complete len:677 (+),score=37.45 TRINITY_DN5455_c1_g2_i2:95-2125(+)